MAKVLIIVPTYNERENIELAVAAFRKPWPNAHLLVVDDNSPDGTGEIADSLAAADSRVHVLHRQSKDGLGAAYLAGFDWGLQRGYQVLVEMDADFSHNPKYLPSMIEPILNGEADAVIGSRYVPGGGTENWGLARRWLSRLGGLYARTVLGVSVNDMTAGFVAWHGDILRRLGLDEISATGFGFQIELKYRAHQIGARITEIPIVFPDRKRGTSKMSGGIAAEALGLVWRLRLKR